MTETRFTWTIKDFDMCPQPPGEATESPCFSIDAERATKFSLLLYPRGQETKATGETYVSLFLKRHFDTGKDKMKLSVYTRLLDKSNVIRNDMKVDRDFCQSELYGHRNFIKRKDLIGTKRLPHFAENVLTVYCVIIDNEDEEVKTSIYDKDDYENLSSHLGELLKSGNHSDTVIKTSGQEFKAHRLILENRCPFLMAKLEKLENSNVYSIPLFEAIVFRSILKYIYTGSYDDDNNLEKVIFRLNDPSLFDLKLSLFPAPCFSFCTTEIIVFNATRPWYISTIDKLEYSCYVFSNEKPEWSWMKVSLMKNENLFGYPYVLKFKRFCENNSTVFLQFDLHDHMNTHYVGLTDKEYLFKNECEWITPIVAENFQQILMLSVRVSACSPDSTPLECLSEKKYIREYQDFPVDFSGNKETFQRYLHDLHRNMKNADVTLRVGSKELPAHKAILGCRSEVFSKMFEHDTKENQTGVVDIEDVDESTMSSLVMYMYCGDIDAPLCVSSAAKLYTAADKYQVLLLKDKCRLYLKDKITTQTIGDILSLAAIQQDEILKKSCYAFLTSHSNEILKDESCLDELKNRLELYPDILDVLLRHISQIDKRCPQPTHINAQNSFSFSTSQVNFCHSFID